MHNLYIMDKCLNCEIYKISGWTVLFCLVERILSFELYNLHTMQNTVPITRIVIVSAMHVCMYYSY